VAPVLATDPHPELTAVVAAAQKRHQAAQTEWERLAKRQQETEAAAATALKRHQELESAVANLRQREADLAAEITAQHRQAEVAAEAASAQRLGAIKQETEAVAARHQEALRTVEAATQRQQETELAATTAVARKTEAVAAVAAAEQQKKTAAQEAEATTKRQAVAEAAATAAAAAIHRPHYPEIEKTHDPALQRGLEHTMERLGMMPYVNQHILGVSIADITHLDQPRIASLNGDQTFYAASLPKIVILLAAFLDIEQGDLPFDPRTYVTLSEMIRVSSDHAATEMLNLVGKDKMRATVMAPRFRFYDPQRGGLWVGKEYGPGPAFDRDPLYNLAHAATTNQTIRFYYLLETNRLVNPALTRQMKSILADPGIPHKFVRGLAQTRPQARIFRKSGSWAHSHSDSAIIESGGHRFIVVALTEHPKGIQWLEEMIAPLHDLIAPASGSNGAGIAPWPDAEVQAERMALFQKGQGEFRAVALHQRALEQAMEQAEHQQRTAHADTEAAFQRQKAAEVEVVASIQRQQEAEQAATDTARQRKEAIPLAEAAARQLQGVEAELTKRRQKEAEVLAEEQAHQQKEKQRLAEEGQRRLRDLIAEIAPIASREQEARREAEATAARGLQAQQETEAAARRQQEAELDVATAIAQMQQADSPSTEQSTTSSSPSGLPRLGDAPPPGLAVDRGAPSAQPSGEGRPSALYQPGGRPLGGRDTSGPVLGSAREASPLGVPHSYQRDPSHGPPFARPEAVGPHPLVHHGGASDRVPGVGLDLARVATGRGIAGSQPAASGHGTAPPYTSDLGRAPPHFARDIRLLAKQAKPLVSSARKPDTKEGRDGQGGRDRKSGRHEDSETAPHRLSGEESGEPQHPAPRRGEAPRKPLELGAPDAPPPVVAPGQR
jgi:beta-lactamase class A